LPGLTANRIEPAKAEPRLEARPRWRRWRWRRRSSAARGAGSRVSVIAARSPYGGSRLSDPLSFYRWDIGQYLCIARSGYTTAPCPHAWPWPPGYSLCGTVDWFPGIRSPSARSRR